MPYSKEFLPPELNKVQPRPRLYNFFEEKHVVIIEAGPGMGKSAAAFDFITNEDKNCVWHRLQKKDSNFRIFLERLEKVLYSYLNNGQQRKKPLSESISPAELADNFCEEIKGKLPDDMYLIFEDFEYINHSPETCTVIERLLEHLSKRIHLIILTRETVKISLARIRTRKELTELKNRDIAFNRDDIHSLIYNLYDMSFDTVILERLIEVTQGWITAIIILLEKICCLNRKEGEHILENFLVTQSIPEIDDYFQTQILPILTPAMADILIKLSEADNFTPHLIEVVSGDSGVQTIKELQRTNMFISTVDPAKYEYIFNPIFRSYLSSEFNKFTPEQKKECLSGIAEYYQQEEDIRSAVKFLCKAELFDEARVELINFAEDLIKNNEYESINDILSFFPAEMQASDPYLSYYNAIVNNLMQPETSRRQLLKLLYIFNSNKDHDREASIYSVLLTNYFFFQSNAETVGNIINMAEEFLLNHGLDISIEQNELLTALIPLGQWWTGASRDKAFEIALRAEETSNRLHNEEAFLCSRLVLSKIYIARGEFHSAKNLLLKTENLFTEGSFHLYKQYQSLSSFYLGDTYFYCGEISTAISQIHKALSSSGTEFAFRPYLELNLVYYNLYLNDIEKADALYERLREREPGENLYLKYNYDFLFEMLIAYRTGNNHRARYYCNRLLEPGNEKLMRSDFPFSKLALAEVSFYTEGAEKSRIILMELMEEITAEEYPYPYATATALLAYISTKSGAKAEAKKWFKRMENAITENNYTNLDICSPDLLREIAEVFPCGAFESFPRLKHDKEYEKLSTSQYELEITTLGSFSIGVKGEEISADLLGGQKRVMDLLKLLIVYRKTGITKERIYELFWPRYSYKSARDNLNTIIYRLRKLLNNKDDFLYTDVNVIRFKENTVITDADKFLEYIKLGTDAEKNGNHEVSTRMFRSAIELYRGDFLENDLYYDFIRDERENLRSKFRSLLFKMILLSLNSAEFHEALEWAKQLIDADPLCEPAYRMLMVSSSAVGNRSEIPRLFDKLNQKLQAYYKVTADEKTVILKDKLLSGTTPDESMWREETII
ncbi:MAG: BTAD domain-containing putative transcriptional regulator [Spirochaetales bacterium]|uniref:BTAD domain-containing putative transcriptional regulator n=1 Tax=Candidatus Thalassospirochaeta sargassi TaxID=3119039 RepID=A0AAJ1ICG7_9SPIO|nr:BTAD domain-containing putative transcriptional regulator [Spirochaetales bacterium]